MTRACLLAFLLVAVAAGAGGIPAEKLSALDIPRLAVPLVIDGVMSPGEWERAAAISGVVDQGDNVLHPRPTTFYLGWDSDRLYLACRTWVMPGYKPRARGREPLAAGVGDDGLELHFQPLGANLPPGQSTTSSYKFFVNALGFVGEPVRVSVGQLFRNWLPEFASAAGMTAPDSAPQGGRWLTIEWSGAVADFELVGPHQAGDLWRMMLGFNHMPGWMQARIPASSGYFDPDGYTEVRLVEGQPVVQAVLDKLPGPRDGTAVAHVRAINHARQPVAVEVEVRYAALAGEAAEQELATLKQTLHVEPGQSAEVDVDQPFARALGTDAGTLSITAASGGQTLLRYFARLRAGHPAEWTRHAPPPEAFPLEASLNPIRGNLSLSGDRYYLPEPEQAVALDYTLRPKRGGRALAAGRIETPRLHVFAEFLELAPIPAGEYVLEAALVLRDGGRIGPVTREFRKLDEATEFAAWWNNGLGGIERVIPPFTAMRTQRDRVSLWGRTYDLGTLGLPDAIESQGDELLAAPVRLVAVVGGKEQVIELEGRPSIREATDWRVRFEGSASGAGLRFTVSGWVEQDGLCYLELTYAPGGRKPVTVDALRLEWPFRAAAAESLLCYGPGGNFSTRTARVLPATAGTLWSSREMGKLGSGMTVGTFFPLVWLGDERRGLLWWADSDRGWVPDDEVPAHEVVREMRRGRTGAAEAVVVLRNHLIGKPFELTAPRTVALSYMASPFRPLVKNWRALLQSADGTFSGGPDWDGIGYKARKDPVTGALFDGWNLLTPPAAEPEQWGPIWAQYKARADAKVQREQWSDPTQARNWMFVHSSLPLVGYGWKSPDQKVVGYFAPAEWGDREAYVPSNIDYYLYLADRAFREGGLRTIYWDIFFPIEHHTLQNGMAYRLPDGRTQPGYAGWNTRRFLMRLYALMHDHGLAPGGQVAHATNAYLLVAAPWVDALLDGEFHKLTDSSSMDWVDGYPVEHMRAMANVHNWGTVISWMNHIDMTGDKGNRVRRGFVDYVRLFDAWRGPNTGNLPEPLLEWGLADERVEYVPFWRNPYIALDDPAVLVSMWRLPDRVLLSVFNHDAEATKTVTLTVDLETLGLVPELPWQEFVRVKHVAEELPAHQQPVFDFPQRRLTVPALAPRTARLITIRRY
jgi:hypothetical protein